MLLTVLRRAVLAAGAVLVTGGAAAEDAAEIAAGERIFRSQCLGCHAVEPGRNRAGPTLYGLIGREAGSVEGFDFSDAMRQAEIAWSPEALDTFLADPSGVVPGTKMVFWGLGEQDRRRVVAYLKSLDD